jgi:hypothetical protein
MLYLYFTWTPTSRLNPGQSRIQTSQIIERLKVREGCRPCTRFIEWYMKMKWCFYKAMYLFVCRDQLKNTCFNNLLLDWFCILKGFLMNKQEVGKQTFFSRPQITNPQILGPMALSQLCKILRYASPQIANLQIFSYWSANRKFANFYKDCTTLIQNSPKSRLLLDFLLCTNLN